MTEPSLEPGASTGMFAAFRIRSFRFQWPADLLTSWAFEMEMLIVGWYVLVITDSAFMLAAIGALQFGGTLLAPMFGVIADRMNRRTMLIALRASYAVLAGLIMALGLIGDIAPWQLFTIAAIGGLIRPSDLVVRNSLIADTVPAHQLRNAMGLSRTTMDSARIVGALLGAGLLSTLGIGIAYGGVAAFYVGSIVLTLGIVSRRTAISASRPWAELKLGLGYMRDNQTIVGIMSLAFLVNLTAFPLSHGLLPVVARDVYGIDENGLAQLLASYAVGALLGSIITAMALRSPRPGRTVAINIFIWYGLLIALGYTQSWWAGAAILMLIGAAQSFGMIAMSVLLLTTAQPEFRGRVQGVRMLAVYGLPVGLLIGGALIEWVGITFTFTLYGLVGIVTTVGVLLRWPKLLTG